VVIVFFVEKKSDSEEILRRSDSFLMMWEKTLDAGGKENTAEMWEEHTGRLFHLNIRRFMRKDSGESFPRNAIGAL